MSYNDIIDNLTFDELFPREEMIIRLYKTSLSYLNKIKLSRFNAMYFGSMTVGNESFSWKDIEEFGLKYNALCIVLLDKVYNEFKKDKQQLIEVTLSAMYSMLAAYVNSIEYEDVDVAKLIKENDTYKNDDLEKEFSGE